MTAAPPFVLAIDQGTTSSRAICFDRDANARGVAQIPVRLDYPRPGWVNQDADEIWRSTLETARRVIADAGDPESFAAIGIANQRETTILWERATGRPVAPAIVWQSRQSAGVVDAIAARGLTDAYRRITGLVPDAYFSATKIAWLFEAEPALRRRAEAGDLLFGTVDSWLIWNLTGGRRHVTDVTNASRTMLFDLASLTWSEPLLADLGIPRAILPEIVPTSGFIAETDTALVGAAIPICAAAGDQQAALFGQACFEPGQAKNTYGTGSFLLMNVGDAPPVSRHQLLATPAWRIREQTNYALEGAIFVTGAAVQWLRDGLGVIAEAAAVEPLATSVPDSAGVVFVPALTGLGAPDWDPHARGAIFGITRGTTAAHIARATLEAIAHQTRDVLDAMIADSGFPVTELRVDGGAARDDLLLQIQADLLGVPVIRPRNVETTALGAAYLAGLSVGVWRSEADIAAHWQVDRVFEPAISQDEREVRHARWRRAVTRSRAWAD